MPERLPGDNVPSDLLSSLTSLVTPDLVSKFAGASGESSSSVSRALGAAFPALLSGFATKADDAAGFESLFGQITSPANNTSILSNPGAWIADVAGGKSSPVTSLAQGALGGLFGGRTDGIANAIGQYAGLKPGAGRTLLSMATPFVLGYLLDVVKKRLLNANGLAELFKRERTDLNAAVPGDLRAALGFAGGASGPPPQRDRVAAAVAPAGDSKWWIWLIPLLLIPLLWWFFRPQAPEGTVVTDTVPVMAPGSGGATPPSSGDTAAAAATPSDGGAGAPGRTSGDTAMGGGTPAGGNPGVTASDTVGAGAMDGAPAATPRDSAAGAMGGQGASGKR